MLALEFLDAPVIKQVTGTVGDAQFVWALLSSGEQTLDVTTTERQQSRLVESWKRLVGLMPIENRRLAAALHYFHTACRLERVGQSGWEFLPEILLNLSKVLETLFPPPSGTGTIDSARAGLRQVGLIDDAIERDFVPVIALRNFLDVGHPSLAVFAQSDLEVVQHFCEKVEASFRDMLRVVTDEVRRGQLALADFTREPREDVLRVIERIRVEAVPTEPSPAVTSSDDAGVGA